jgi:hypothetical protein
MSAPQTLDNVAVATKANVFFDGRCVSHTVTLADGTRKSCGVILPGAGPITFNVGAAEIMETVAGECEVMRTGESAFTRYGEGQSFAVPANTSFEIRVAAPYHYVCHFG